jgi:hypothetical protein
MPFPSLSLALLLAIFALLMAFFAGLKTAEQERQREFLRQKQAWDAAVKQDLRALPDSFTTPKWKDEWGKK